MVEATYRVRRARKQLYSKNGRHPGDEEIAEATGLTMKRLTAVMLTPKAPRSLEQKIGINQSLKPSVFLHNHLCVIYILPFLIAALLPCVFITGSDCRP